MGVESDQIRGRLRVEQYRFGCDFDPLLGTADHKRHIDRRSRVCPQDHVRLMVGLESLRLSCDLVGSREEIVELVGSDAAGHRITELVCTHVPKMNFCSRYCAAARISNDTSQGCRKRLGKGAWNARCKKKESNP